jgi:T1SS-143 domain-containing protein
MEDSRISTVDHEAVSQDFASGHDDTRAVEGTPLPLLSQNSEIAEFQLAQVEQANSKTDRLATAEPLHDNAPQAMQITPDQGNIVQLPPNTSIDDIHVEGRNLVLIQAGGTRIVIINGALHIPTFMLGEVTLPQQAVVAALQQQGVNVAEGPDGSYSAGSTGSGHEFTDSQTQNARTPLHLLGLLGPGGGIGDGGGNNSPGNQNGLPFIDPFQTLTASLSETGNASGSFVTQSSTGRFGFGGFNASISTVTLFRESEITDSGTQQLAGVTSGGSPVVVSQNGQTVTGTANGVNIFTLVFDKATGVYTFTQTGAIDHPTGANSVKDVLELQFQYTVVDKRGDTVTGIGKVDITDSVPVAGAGTGKTVSEAALPVGNDTATDAHITVTSTTGSLNISWGADSANTDKGGLGDRSVAFTNANVAVSGEDGSTLTSHGLAVSTVVLADGTLIGYTGAVQPTSLGGGDQGINPNIVFYATVSDTDTGHYSFTLVQSLDDGDKSDAVKLTFNYTATDSDGDIAANSFTVTVDDDKPVSTGDITGAVLSDDAQSGANTDKGDTPTATATGEAGALFTSGADGFQKVSLDSPADFNAIYKDANGVGHVETASWGATVSGGITTWTATAGEDKHAVATLTINADGSYSFTLSEPLAHTAAGEDQASLKFSYTVTDGDNDTATGSLTINVTDDVPVSMGAITAATLNDDAQNGGNLDGVGDAKSASGGVGALFSAGADGLKSVSIENLPSLKAIYIDGNGVGHQENVKWEESIAGGTTIWTASGLHSPAAAVLTIHADGSYTFTTSAALAHPTAGLSEESLALKFNYTVTDGDGDTATGSLTVNVTDDVPTVSVLVGSPVTADESPFLQDDDIGLSTAFIGIHDAGAFIPLAFAQSASAVITPTAAFGADGKAVSGAVAYSLSLSSSGVDSGLKTTDGKEIRLFKEGNLVVGRYDGQDSGTAVTSTGHDPAAFALSIGSDGKVTVVQYVSLNNGGMSSDAIVAIASGAVSAVVTIKDGDGDTATANADISARISFQDDGPQVFVGRSVFFSVMADESAGLQADDKSSFSAFTEVTNIGRDGDNNNAPLAYAQSKFGALSDLTLFGVDGAAAAGSKIYSLSLSSAGVDSGLQTTDGKHIYLFAEGDLIVGRVAGVNGAIGSAAFAVAIDHATGRVSTVEYLSLLNGNANNPNDIVSIATHTISAVLTVTDGDGSTASGSADISAQIQFADDAPITTGAITATALNDDAQSGGNLDGVGGAKSVSGGVGALFSAGVDGFKSISIENLPSLNAIYIDGNGVGHQEAVTWKEATTNGTTIWTASGLHSPAAAVLTINADGSYTFTTSAALVHPTAGLSEESLALKFSYTVTDGDNDTATGSLTVNVKDDVPTITGVITDRTLAEADLVSSNSHATSTGDIGLNISFGADGAAATGVTFADTNSASANIVAVGSDGNTLDLAKLTSGGHVLQYSLASDGKTLTAYYTENHSTITVFSVALSENTSHLNGAYNLTLYKPLDDVDGKGLLSSITLSFNIVGHDGDGDATPTQTFAVTVNDDTPHAVAGTAISLAEDAAPIQHNVFDTGTSTRGADGATLTSVTIDGEHHDVMATGPTTVNVAEGVYTFQANGNWTFNPALNQDNANGKSASFDFTIKDGDGDTSTATQIISVTDGRNPTVGVVLSQTPTVYLNLDEADLATSTSPNHGQAETDSTGLFNQLVFTAHSDDIAVAFSADTSDIKVLGLTGEETIVWTPTGSTLVGHLNSATGTTLITLTISGDTSASAGGDTATPKITATLNNAFDDSGSLVTISGVKVVATDTDGDTATGYVHISIVDDVPVISSISSNHLISVNEGDLRSAASATGSAVLNVGMTYGADGAGTETFALALGLTNSSGFADSGLKTTTGQEIYLYKNSDGSVVGVYHGSGPVQSTDLVAFKITLDNLGNLGVAQNVALYDAKGFILTSQLQIDAFKLYATVQVTDKDGDSTSRSLDLSSVIIFKDDTPTVSLAASSPLVVSEGISVDQTATVVSTTAAYGADGAAGSSPILYTLDLQSGQHGAIDSGLQTIDHQKIYLVETNGAVLGEYGSPNHGQYPNIAFTISVDPTTGAISVKENVALYNAHGATLTISNAQLFEEVTIKDGDGDTAPVSRDITGLIQFQDGAPTTGTVATQTVGENGLAGTPLLSAGASLKINFGADGAAATGAVAFAATPTVTANYKDQTNAVQPMSSLTSGGQALVFSLVDGVLNASTATSHVLVFTVSLALASDGHGAYSFTLYQPLDHSDPIVGNDHTIDLAFIYTATDRDGSSTPGTFSVEVSAAGMVSDQTIDYSALSTGVLVNLADTVQTIGGHTLAANTASDAGATHLVGIDNLNGITQVTGTSGNDTLVGGAGDKLIGGAGSDTFVAAGSIVTISDLSGGDVVKVLGGAVADITATGNWTAMGDNANDGTATIHASGHSIDLSATTGAQGWTLTNAGNATGVTLIGSANADAITGGDGNDTLTGGAGDTLLGSAGDDTFIATGSTVTISDLAGGDIVKVLSGAMADVIATGNWTATSDTANDGLATIHAGRHSIDLSAATGAQGWTLTNAGNTTGVTLTGSANSDTIIGGDGNDTIEGGRGGDNLSGGAGDDTFVIGPDIDDAGSYGPRTVDLGNGVVITVPLSGMSGNGDTIIGGIGTDTIQLVGAGGNGYVFDNRTTSTPDLQGIERIVGTDGNDMIAVAANYQSDATGGGITIDGGKGDDVIFGGAGADTLVGRSGNDKIIAGKGSDTITGGTGSDTIYYSVGDGQDRIDGGATVSGSVDSDKDMLHIVGDGNAHSYTIGELAQGTADNIASAIDKADLTVTIDGAATPAVRADGIEDLALDLGSSAGNTITFGNVSDTSLLQDTITINTGSGSDTLDLSGLSGNVHIVINDTDTVGGSDTDTLKLAGKWSDWTATHNVTNDSYTLTKGNEMISVKNVEEFTFMGENGGAGGTISLSQLVNVAPLAANFTASNAVTEDSSSEYAEGYILHDNHASDVNENIYPYETLAVVGVNAGTTPSSTNNVAGQNGTVIQGTYGHLTIFADGAYKYLLDDLKTETNALSQSEQVKDVFDYTVGDAHGLISSATITIDVSGSNDVPTISGTSATAYTENASGTVVNSSLVVNDVDNTMLQGATVTITNFVVGQDVLSFTSQNGITGTYVSGILTLSGSATVADYQTALRSVTYSNGSDNPSTSARTITFVVDDGQSANHASTTITSTVSINAVNDAPFGADKTLSITEHTSHTFTATDFGFSDSADANNLASIKITSLPSQGTLALDGHEISLANGAFVVAASDIGKLVLTPNANFVGSSETLNFQFKVQDNGGTANGGVDTSVAANTMTVSIGAVNDGYATMQTTDGTASHPSGATYVVGDVLTASIGTDPDGAESGIVYTWTRDNGAILSIGAAYTLGANDVGHTVTATATYTDGQGFHETVAFSIPTAVAAATTPGAHIYTDAHTSVSFVDDALAWAGGISDPSTISITSGGSLQNGSVTATAPNLLYKSGATTYQDAVSFSSSLSTHGNDTADDILIATSTGSTLKSGSGNDVLIAKSGPSSINWLDFSHPTTNTMSGGSGNNLFIGGDGFVSDAMSASSGKNVYLLGSHISGWQEATTDIAGGSGSDTLDFSNIGAVTGAGVTFTLEASGTNGNNEFDLGGDHITYSSVEGIRGTQYADALTLNDNAQSGTNYNSKLEVDGGTGTDTLYLDSSSYRWVDSQIVNVENVSMASSGTLDLSLQSEGMNITGSTSADTIYGGLGNDVITGGAGADTIHAGDGDDTIYGMPTDSMLDGGNGTDTLMVAGGLNNSLGNSAIINIENVTMTSAGILNLASQTESLTLTGSAGADTITGGSGNDTIIGGKGADILNAASGTETFAYYAGDTAATVSTSSKIVTGYDVISNFTSSGISHDVLALAGSPIIATDVSSKDGSNSTVGNVTISSHQISAGIISFDDINAYNNAISINSQSGLAAVVQYLEANNLGANTTVAFGATITGVSHTYIYEQVGSSPSATNDILIDLTGVDVSTVSGKLSTFITSHGAIDPIVLDLDHNGIALTLQSNGVSFDLNGDGVKDHVAWTATGAHDGLLAIDLNHDGQINSGNELFTTNFDGGKYDSGMAALSTLDTNHDGKIDASDAAYSQLAVWQDLDHNGITDAGELTTLANDGISSISLSTTASSATIAGQSVLSEGSFINADGSTGHLSEVALDTGLGQHDAGQINLVGTEGSDTLTSGGGYSLTGGAGADTFVLDARALHGLNMADVITDFSPKGDGDKLDVSNLLNALVGEHPGMTDASAVASMTAVVDTATNSTAISVNTGSETHVVATLQNYAPTGQDAVHVLFNNHEEQLPTHTQTAGA